MTTDAFVAHLRRRWWLVLLQAVLAAVIVVAVTAATAKTSYSYTAEFVMHPAPGTPTGDVANLAQELSASGPVVQTVLHVVSTPGMVERAAQRASVSDIGPYSVSASISPGTTVFDVTITGPDQATVQKLGDALETVAPPYVAASYHGYSFDLLGNNVATNRGFPPRTDVVLLAFLLGAVVGAGEAFAEFTYLQGRAGRTAAAEARDNDAARLAIRDRTPAAADAMYAGAAPNGDGNHNGNNNGGNTHQPAVKVNGRVPAKKQASRAPSSWRAPQQRQAPR